MSPALAITFIRRDLRNLFMPKVGTSHAVYKFYETLLKDPRFCVTKFHKTLSPYKHRDTSAYLINSVFKANIIVGPFLYCNYGFSVELHEENKNPLKLLRELERTNDPTITHAMALTGDHTLLIIRKGGNEITFAEAIKPSFVESMKLENFDFSEKGNLPVDPLPDSWNELDWKVFHAMRNPRISFWKASGKVGVSWMTVKRRYEKILKGCKVLAAYFPLGYNGYPRLLVTLKTLYEKGLRESLQKLDRSSYLWKFNDTIILILFVDDYNRTCERFSELEEIGMVHDLRMSIPIRFFEPHINLDRGSLGLRHHPKGEPRSRDQKANL